MDTVFHFAPTTEADILNIIKQIKSKAFGEDGLNIDMIYLCCPCIVPVVTHIINTCIIKGHFPSTWKKALIIPIPKINDPKHFGDLRSISILPTFSKVMERVMELQMRAYLNNNSLLPLKQSGFRRGYGCATALVDILDDIVTAYDNNKSSILILLDYSKAFDTINHTLLVAILQYIGFDDMSCSLVASYLNNREQRVLLNDKISLPSKVKTGVPQGSILSPILYTIYTSNFCDTLQHANYHFYADDTQVYYTFDITELDNLNNVINSDLNALVKISTDHSLNINANKSAVLVVCHDHHRDNIKNSLNIKIGDRSIPIQSSIKDLGLLLDSKLRFRQHITNKIKSAYSALKCIYSQRQYLEPNTKKMLCDSLVLSHFNYCDIVYGPSLDATDIKRIQKVQNSCVRLIFGIRKRNRVSHKFKDLAWLNMHNRRQLHLACFYQRLCKDKTPEYLYRKLTFRTDVHNLNIRRKTIVTVPHHRKEIFKRCFSYNAAIHINNIFKQNSMFLNMLPNKFKKVYKCNLLTQQNHN